MAACGGAAPADEIDEATIALEASSAIVDTTDVGAIVYEEEDPEPGTNLNACKIISAADVQPTSTLMGLSRTAPSRPIRRSSRRATASAATRVTSGASSSP